MKKALILGACAVLALGALAGCNRDPGPSDTTKTQSSRLEQIRQNSGGDWSKLSAEDKDYLVKELAHGNEQSAKMLLGPAAPPKPAGAPGGK